MPYKDKERQREYQRKYAARRRAEYFSDKCCVVCGSVEQLELDHIDKALKDQKMIEQRNSNLWSWSEERRLAELAKCQVLCKPCHRDKTSRENITEKHGTPAMYERHKCRCDECKQWKRVKNSKRYLPR